MLTKGSGLFVAFSTFSTSLIEDLFSSYRQDCSRANRNLVATKWIMSQKSDDVPKLDCKRRFLFFDFALSWLFVRVHQFPWYLLQSREMLPATFRKAKQICCWQALLEKRVVCNRCLQSPSCDKLSCDICGKKHDLLGEHLAFDFSLFLQDMVDDVKYIFETMVPSFRNKGLLLLGRAGDGKTPRACMCALDLEVHQLHILKGLSCERAILGKGQGQKEDRAWEQEAMEAGLKDTRGLRVCCMSGTRQQCQNVNTRVVLKAPMRDGKQCGVFEIADLDELRENNCDAAGVLEFGWG